MKLSDFDFDLPPSHIAQAPKPRGQAKMLHVADNLTDLTIADIAKLVQPRDVMVFKNTKVIPALLKGYKLNALGEKSYVTINLHKYGQGTWQVFAKPGKKLKLGDTITFSENCSAEVLAKLENGMVELKFNLNAEAFFAELETIGAMPLPPYIKRDTPQESDNELYQTVFAKEEGAVAAPTAGLHFTEEMLAQLKSLGVTIAYVTLHVGGGTFLPVKTEDIREHEMHSEYISIDADNCAIINKAKRVVCVGTTSLRVIESVADETGSLTPFTGETDIFITPGYKFKAADVLMTNFHLPKSTLFMLVSAFSGLDKMQQAYKHAIDKDYRFFSYGDACWLEKIPVE